MAAYPDLLHQSLLYRISLQDIQIRSLLHLHAQTARRHKTVLIASVGRSTRARNFVLNTLKKWPNLITAFAIWLVSFNYAWPTEEVTVGPVATAQLFIADDRFSKPAVAQLKHWNTAIEKAIAEGGLFSNSCKQLLVDDVGGSSPKVLDPYRVLLAVKNPEARKC